MATPDELRSTITEARETLRGTLEAAGDGWENVPGADDWSAKQTAEHAVQAMVYFAGTICETCGYPDPENPFRGEVEFTTPAEALAGLEIAAGACDSILKHVSEEDLSKQHERWGSVADLLALDAHHLTEHAEQIRRAANA